MTKLVTRPIVLTGRKAAGSGARRAALLLAAWLFAAGLLGACGQKGPLVLPGYPKEANWPYPPRPAPASKPEQQQRKAPDVPATSDSTK